MRGNSDRTDAARQLRRSATPAERALWNALRDRRLDGVKFRRQEPLGPFVVDFCCAERRLIVEIDGDVHKSQRAYDSARSAYLKAHGYTVLRVSNDDVFNRFDVTIDRIRAALHAKCTPTPLSPDGERGRG